MNGSLKSHAIFLFLILGALFSTSLTFNYYDKQIFQITKTAQDGKYLVYAIEEGDPSINYVLSATSSSNAENRLQMAQSYLGKVKLYVNMDRLTSINIEVECSSYPCSGTTSSEFTDKIVLNDGDQVNYYVNNEEYIYFSANLKPGLSNIWARGQNTIQVSSFDNLNPSYTKKISDSFSAYIFQSSSNVNVNFYIIAKKGDYINAGFIGYSKDGDYYHSNVPLDIEGPIITGLLHKSLMNKICYDLKYEQTRDKVIIGSGILFTKIAMTHLITKVEGSPNIEQISPLGILKNIIVEQYSQLCLSFPDSTALAQYEKVDDIVFTYHAEYLEKKEYIEKEPQLNGILYPRAIYLESKVAFISHKDGTFEKMSLNLNSIRGFPKMYVYKCDNYPLCDYKEEKFKEAIRPRNINRFSSYNVKKEAGYDDSPISRKQTLFVVECTHAEKGYNEEHTYMDSLCDFNSLINKENTAIRLNEENFFNQYALLNEEHFYKIQLGDESGIQKVFIDIMTYVGDVEVNTKPIKDLGIAADQYDSVNKLFLSVKTNGKIIDELNFSVKGMSNTFYTILVTFARNKDDEDSFITNILQSGMSYLVTIDNEKTSSTSNANKIIKFRNERMVDSIPYLVNFYSLNCEVSVGFKKSNEDTTTPIEKFEHFSHDIVKAEDIDKYYSSAYLYQITVITPDPSEYENNLCKIYTSAVELSKAHDDYTRDILIPDNTPQQIMLGGNSNHISFGYIHVDFKNDLLVKFNLKHPAQYKVQLYYENHVRNHDEVIIVADNLLYLSANEWSDICRDNSRVCYIQLDIILDKTKDYEKPLLEVSMKSIGSNFVDYVPKNHLKIDYVQNNSPQYYYTELGRNEDGFIIANFLRGSGKVTARIVNKDLKEPESGAKWRGKYRLPSENETNDYKMDSFTKKLKFDTYSYNCDKGCYLIISVYSDVKSERIKLQKGINLPYSLIVQSFPKTINYLKIPTVRIPLDEYIIGTVDPTLSSYRITQFYSVWLNADADFVVIDWQSDGGSLFIKVGDEKPTMESFDKKISGNGQDAIHKISKDEILSKKPASHTTNSLQDIVLTIGVWTDLTDSIYTTPFSFAVRLEEKENEIYRVNSDQKVLCKANKIGENKYRCVYVVDYHYIHQYAGLFAYANLQDKSSNFGIYASFINATIYEMSSKTGLKNLIPSSSKYEHSTEKEKKDYLYLLNGTKIDTYILVTVELSIETTVELVSTIFLFEDEITPNPSSSQLMSTYEGYDIVLNFPTEYMEMVNIICVGGSGVIYWKDEEDKIYYLKGRDDRISITSSKSNNEHKLIFKGLDNIAVSEPFVVIVEYNIRGDYSNFDSLNLEKSVNYIYTNSDFPIVLYCPLSAFNMESKDDDYYDIFFSYYNLETTEEKSLTYYESYSFIANGFIVKESIMYDAKLNPSLTPEVNSETIFGFYDPGMRSGLIRIKASRINKTDEKLYLFLKLDKSDQFRNVRKYKSISLETTAFHKNSQSAVSELANQFGYLNINQTEAIYKLRNFKDKKYLNLEFSCEDDNINVYINNEIKNPNKQQFGKKFYSLDPNTLTDMIDLKLARNGDKGKDSLQFFFFRYTFSDNEINSKYSISNTKIKVTQTFGETTSNYTIELTPIDNYTQYNVTYIVRLITDRAMPKSSHVSMRIGIQNVKEFYNPKPEGNTLKFQVTDAAYKTNYIQVVVQIREKEDVEYLSYDLQNNYKQTNPPSSNNDKKNTTLLVVGIVVGVVLVIIIVALVIVILIFNNKNKDLLEKVNKVSFADNDQRGDDDLLLSKE